MPRLRDIHPLTALGFLLAVVVFTKNAWVSDDAYIMFRSLEQLAAGHGPVWNPHERVQVFTSPLWFALLAAVRIVSADVFVNALALGLALWLACLAVIRRLSPSPAAFLLMVLALSASNGLSDFTSSGLENGLLYFLLALLVLAYARTTAPDSDPRSLTRLWFVAGLILLTRLDQVFLVAPVLVGVTWRRRRILDRRQTGHLLLVGLGPLLVWTVFAVVYYGFPLANSAYAKLNTGLDGFVLFRQGLKYLLVSLGRDTITLAGLGVFIRWGLRDGRSRPLAVGAVLQLGYVAWVGGDFMQGRFLASCYLVAVLTGIGLAGTNLAVRRALWVGLLAYVVFYPHTPVNTGLRYSPRPIALGVADERGIYNDVLSLPAYWACRRTGRVFPDMVWRRDGERFAASEQAVITMANIGVFGYASGTEKIIIDSMALSDPLLARLPVTGTWRVGHYPRRIPAGYPALLAGEKTGGLEDAHLQELYADMLVITRSPRLLGARRLHAIRRRNF